MTTPPQPPGDDELRRLLDDAVAHVEPAHGLDAIRSRTKVTPMSAARPWFLAAGAAVLATAATITVVNLAGDDSPAATPPPGPAAAGTTSPAASPAQEPSTAASTSSSPSASTSSPPAPATSAVPAYYVGETSRGPRLFREFHAVVGDGNPEAQAVHEAVAVGPDDPDYATLWPKGADVNHVEMSGDTIVVDLGGASLHDRPASMTKAQAEMSVEQVLYTAQAAFQDRAPVRLLLDGKVTDQVLGVPAPEPLAQGDAASTLAQVWILDPTQGETVSSGFTVSGLAAAFEANVQWELMQGGTVVKKGFTTARECCTMAPYSFTVAAAPGDYTIVVHDEDASGAGRPTWQDTKDVTVR